MICWYWKLWVLLLGRLSFEWGPFLFEGEGVDQYSIARHDDTLLKLSDVLIGSRYVLLIISSYILNPLYTTLFEWKSNEIIQCLPITNPVFAGSKQQHDFMIRSIKRVPGTHRDLMVNIELSPWKGSKVLKDLNWILWKGLWSSFFKKEYLC